MSLFFWTCGSLLLWPIFPVIDVSFLEVRVRSGPGKPPGSFHLDLLDEALRVESILIICQMSLLIKIRGHLRSSFGIAVSIILPVWYESSWGEASRLVLLQTAAVPPTSTDLQIIHPPLAVDIQVKQVGRFFSRWWLINSVTSFTKTQPIPSRD